MDCLIACTATGTLVWLAGLILSHRCNYAISKCISLIYSFFKWNKLDFNIRSSLRVTLPPSPSQNRNVFAVCVGCSEMVKSMPKIKRTKGRIISGNNLFLRSSCSSPYSVHQHLFSIHTSNIHIMFVPQNKS